MASVQNDRSDGSDRRAAIAAAAAAIRWGRAQRTSWAGTPVSVESVRYDLPPAAKRAFEAPPPPPLQPDEPPAFEELLDENVDEQPALHELPPAPPAGVFEQPLEQHAFDADVPAELPVEETPAEVAEPLLPDPRALYEAAQIEEASLPPPAPKVNALKQQLERARSAATASREWLAEHARGLHVPRPSPRAIAAVVAVVVAIGLVGTVRSNWAKWRAAAPSTGTAVFESAPSSADLSVDDVPVGKTPYTAKLKPGNHVAVFKLKNATRTVAFSVTAGKSETQRVDWNAKGTGQLEVNTDPTGARVILDGKARGVTPLKLDDVAAGSHTIVFQSAQGSVQRTVSVNAGSSTEVTESIYPGWLKLFSTVELEISEGSRVVRLDEQSQALLSPGPHELRFQNRALGFRESRRVDIKPGEIASVSVIPGPSTISVTSSQPAEVRIDGAIVGDTPLVGRPVNLGTRDVVVRSTAGAERRFTITVTSKPVQLDVDFSK